MFRSRTWKHARTRTLQVAISPSDSLQIAEPTPPTGDAELQGVPLNGESESRGKVSPVGGLSTTDRTEAAFSKLAQGWNRVGGTSGFSPWFVAAVLQDRGDYTIAVLPFKNLSTEPGSDYFSDGLTDEIISDLSVIDGLQVKSRTSSFFFKDKAANIRDVGAQLGAKFVLEGSVLRAGDKLRVNARLVRVSDDVPFLVE